MLVNLPIQPSLLAKINEQNRQFWLEQAVLLNRRVQDEALYEVAMETLSGDEAKRVHIRDRDSLEVALGRAENWRTIFLRGMARKGGKSGKPDALACWIMEMVRVDEKISTAQLLLNIRRLAKNGDSIFSRVGRRSDTSCDHREYIHFDDNGESKIAPVSGAAFAAPQGPSDVPLGPS